MEKTKLRLSPLTKVMITLIPAGLLVILYLYAFDKGKAGNVEQPTVKSVFIPENKVPWDTIESKSLLYDREKAQYASEQMRRRRDNLSVGDIIEITERKKACEKSERDLLRERLYGQLGMEETAPSQPKIPERASAQSAKKPTQRAVPKTSHTGPYEITQPAPPPHSHASSDSAGEKHSYSLGVYSSATAKTKPEGGEFLTGFLENNIELRQGAEPVFVLKTRGSACGVTLEKMAILYGTTRFENNRWNVYINRALNTDGKYYSVDLVGYNSNMQKGIFYEGRADKALGESINETLETAGAAASRGHLGRIMRSGTRALEVTPQLPLDQGYVMYFKENH